MAHSSQEQRAPHLVWRKAVELGGTVPPVIPHHDHILYQRDETSRQRADITARAEHTSVANVYENVVASLKAKKAGSKMHAYVSDDVNRIFATAFHKKIATTFLPQGRNHMTAMAPMLF